jgi:hypothetical protein
LKFECHTRDNVRIFISVCVQIHFF